MQSNRGFTMVELMIAMALIVILAAMGIPALQESIHRNAVWSTAELIGSQIRQARLKAISRNKTFKVQFNCPSTGQFRILEVTGNSAVDNHSNRCNMNQTYDSGVLQVGEGVSFGTPPTFTVTSRGVFSSTGGIPATVTVSYGSASSRDLTVSATGQITFETY